MKILKGFVEIFRLHPNYEDRVFGLDLMRALAIIFVVMVHGLMLEKADTGFPWILLINGVELFFVLSGFLIGGILLKIFMTDKDFTLRTIGNFWIRRWFRTLPNYYLVLLLNIFVVYFGIIKEDFNSFNWTFFVFMQNFAGPFTGFFWESWSLSIEEWFYLLFPLILITLFVVLRRTKLEKKHIFLAAITVFLLVPFLFRVFKASKFDVDDFWLDVKIFKVVIYRLDSIALGLFAALIRYLYPKTWFKSRNIAFIAGVAVCYISLYSNWPPNNGFTKIFQVFIVSFGCFLLLPKFDSMKKAPRIIVKIFTHISLISYSMYLLNLALVAEIIMTNFAPTGPRSAWFLYIVYWIFVVALSTLLYKYYEKPMMDLRDKFKLKKN